MATKRAKDAGESERTIHEFTMRLPVDMVERMDVVLDHDKGERRANFIRSATLAEIRRREELADSTDVRASRGAKRNGK